MMNSRKQLIAQIEHTYIELHGLTSQETNYKKKQIKAINYKVVFLAVLVPLLFLWAHKKNKGKWMAVVINEVVSIGTLTLITYFKKQLFDLLNNRKF